MYLRLANFPYMHYIVYKSPTTTTTSDKTLRYHVTSSDVAKQPQTQQQQQEQLSSRHRHQHHSTSAVTSLQLTANDVNHQFIDVLRSRGINLFNFFESVVFLFDRACVHVKVLYATINPPGHKTNVSSLYWSALTSVNTWLLINFCTIIQCFRLQNSKL